MPPYQRLLIVGVVSLLTTLVPVAHAQDASELRVAENTFPTSLDSDVGFAGYSLMSYGIAEALMRVTPEMQVAPWLATSLTQLDPLTWRATIRSEATFWDAQQTFYMTTREDRFAVMFDAIQATVGAETESKGEFVALDLLLVLGGRFARSSTRPGTLRLAVGFKANQPA